MTIDSQAYTHLDKVFWPEEGYTKKDLLEYYQKISPFILPYLKDRPLTLHRFPNGIKGESFYQKNVTHLPPKGIPTVLIPHSEKNLRYLYVKNETSLLYVVNLGSIDLNPFNSRINHLDHPDYCVIDLDPEKIEFEAVIETAQAFYELLSARDIPCYCKTSGASGLHIFLPLAAKYTDEQSKQFAQLLAHLVNQKLPDITSLERMPDKRQGKVYLDCLQNRLGQTVAAAYCVRPLPHAPVSTPLNWSEVKKGLNPTDFTIKTIFKYI